MGQGFSVSFLNGAIVVSALFATSCMPTKFSSQPEAAQVPSTDPGAAATAPDSSGAQKVSESFNQNKYAGQVDILFVIDNSYSMQSLQSKVASRFGQLANSLTAIDYHIGLTTTDMDSKNYNVDGRLQPWSSLGSNTLTPLVSGADTIFSQSIVRPETLACTTLTYECPSGNEQPLKATLRAVQQKDTANAGFFRDGAPLAVVVLSSEDELSDGVTATTAQDTGAPLSPTPAGAVLSAVASAFGPSKKFMYNGIIVRPGDSACLSMQRNASQSDGSYFGSHVAQLAQLTGGSTYSICDSDYGKSLKDIADRVRDLIGTFQLKRTPKDGSLSVKLTPDQPGLRYRVRGSQLIFDVAPPAGTKIDVSYEPGS